MRRLRISLLAVVLFAGAALLPARPAHAVSADVRTVLLTSLYGLLGGTAIGAASYPFHQSVRGIFVCSSIGMYLGAATGLYLVHNWDQFEGYMRETRGPRAGEPRWMQAHLDASVSASAPLPAPGPAVTFRF